MDLKKTTRDLIRLEMETTQNSKKEIEPFATRFLESASGEYAKSYKMLSQMMGHSSIKITLDLYSHLTEETVKTEIDKFSNYMDRMVFA